MKTWTVAPVTSIAARSPALADVQQSEKGNIVELELVIVWVVKMPMPWYHAVVHALPLQLPGAQCVANTPCHVRPVCRCSSSM